MSDVCMCSMDNPPFTLRQIREKAVASQHETVGQLRNIIPGYSNKRHMHVVLVSRYSVVSLHMIRQYKAFVLPADL